MKTKIELSQDNHSKLDKICKHLNTGEESFIKSLISNELENNIYLIDNYVYDKRKKVLMQENSVMDLCNLELQLFDLLANNLDNYISNEKLINHISPSNKMSIYSLRNIIKGIRDKTLSEILINKSNIRYKIDYIF